MTQSPSPEEKASEFLALIANELRRWGRTSTTLSHTTHGLARVLRMESPQWKADYPLPSSLAAKISRAIARCRYKHPDWTISRAEFPFEAHDLYLNDPLNPDDT